MKKIKFEELDNIEEIIEVCRKKNKGLIEKTWLEIVKDYNLPIKPEALSRFAKYIGIHEEYMKSHGVKNGIEEIIELKKEKMKISDERRELNRSIRELARMENLKETLLEMWEKEEPINIFEKREKIVNKESNREGVVVISDVHYGILVNNEVNKYSPNICKESFEKLYKEILNNIDRFNLRKINVLLAGDLVSGIIHTNLRLQQGEDVIKQVKGVANILATFIENLNKIVEVEVHYTIGNHSRIMEDKKLSLSSENFEHLIPWYLNAKTSINIKENNSDIALFDVCGYKVASLHGHQVAPNSAYEYIIRRMGVIPNCILIAHYHNDSRIDKGCPVITNGSMVGTDEYALEKGFNSTPHQKLIIFEEGEGEIATIKINFIRK